MQKKIDQATRSLQKSIPAARQSTRRPRYPFLPPANWMNDPNGTIYHNGEFHLFYQFNPAKPRWGNLHWGHAKSADLVHWEHLPIALAPEGSPQESHCWSGCCVIADDGTPTILYTSMSAQALLTRAKRGSQQWLATGSPDLLTWQKYPGNPILHESIHGDLPVQQWRDPYVWKEGRHWLMVLAGEYPGEKLGRVFLYRSADLRQWEFVSQLAQDPIARGRGWECPNYFRLGSKSVLVVSPYGPVIYSMGEFDGQQHHAETWRVLDHGRDFYATNTYFDERGRTILVGWIKAGEKGKWAGCLSLPRLLTLDPAGDLRVAALPELESLRRAHQHYAVDLADLTEHAGTAPFFGESIEIKACFELQTAESFGFTLEDDKTEHKIALDFPTQTISVLDESARLEFPVDSGALELHLFIDQSVIEIFINGREAFTKAFAPQLTENHALSSAPFVLKGKGRFSVDFWKLAGIGLDR
jgi:beta-fructofuranosidase